MRQRIPSSGARKPSRAERRAAAIDPLEDPSLRQRDPPPRDAFLDKPVARKFVVRDTGPSGAAPATTSHQWFVGRVAESYTDDGVPLYMVRFEDDDQEELRVRRVPTHGRPTGYPAPGGAASKLSLSGSPRRACALMRFPTPCPHPRPPQRADVQKAVEDYARIAKRLKSHTGARARAGARAGGCRC